MRLLSPVNPLFRLTSHNGPIDNSTAMFNLETALATWRRAHETRRAFLHEDLNELEEHLRDHIEVLVSEGMTEEQAFRTAVDAAGDIAGGEAEYNKVKWAKLQRKGKAGMEVRWYAALLKSYVTVAIRTLQRQKTYALVNGIGLTLGLATCALVALFVFHERSYDTNFTHHETTYQINPSLRTQWYSTVGFGGYGRSPEEEQKLLPTYLEAIPGIEDAVQIFIHSNRRYVGPPHVPVEVDATLFTNTGAAFLSMFTPSFLAGDPTRALDAPYSVLLTAPLAEKLFADGEALGQTINVDTLVLTVTGVVAPLPETAHFDFDLVVHAPRIPYWGAYTYVRTAADVDPTAILPPITAALDQANPRRVDNPSFGSIRLLPITDIHFTQDALYPLKPSGDRSYVWFFMIAGLLVLCTSCLNYMNLSVAMYAGRTQEMAVRKTFGAPHRTVAMQYLTEAILFALLCVPLVLILVSAVLPAFNALMGLSLTNAFIGEPVLFMGLISLAFFTGLIAGSYPAFVLARRSALTLFRKLATNHRQAAHGLNLRRGLILTQFVLVVGLGAMALIMNQQMRFIAEADLGVNLDGVLMLPGIPDIEAYRALETRIIDTPEVLAMGWGGGPSPAYNRAYFRGGDSDAIYDDGNFKAVSLSWFDVMQVKAPSLEAMEATNETLPEVIYLVNQTAAKRLGWADPKGEVIVEAPNSNGGEGYPYTIDGLAPDIHLFSLHESIRPLFMFVYPESNWFYDTVVRVNTDDVNTSLAALEDIWKDMLPDVPYAPVFLRDQVEDLYQQDSRMRTLASLLTGLALLLGGLGLFGLSAYVTVLRRKEISIRRVLGATTRDVLVLINREFVLLAIAALAIATPLVLWLAPQWLARFAYQIPLGATPFLWIGGAMLTLVFLAVSYQTLRAAWTNPSQTLRYE